MGTVNLKKLKKTEKSTLTINEMSILCQTINNWVKMSIQKSRNSWVKFIHYFVRNSEDGSIGFRIREDT